jgi:predicted Zn-dependent protease
VIYFNQRAYILVGITRDPGSITNFDVAFLETARSFHQLTEDERLLAKPLRLKIIESTEATNFKSLASQSPLEQYQEEKLRLLNGLYPTGKASSKPLLKIVN